MPNDELIALLPDDLRVNVATVSKRTNNEGYVPRENDTSVISETPDLLWLLSMSEVYGRLTAQWWETRWSSKTYDAEGGQYRLYADKGVTTTSHGFCAKGGADSWWRLRSHVAYDSSEFRGVTFDGDWGARSADFDGGVSPGFYL